MKLIIDGNHLACRNSKNPRLATLTTSKGVPSGLIYGFLRSIKALSDVAPYRDMVVCWDTGRSTQRKKLTPGYKANREGGGLDSFQMDDIKDVLRSLGVIQLAHRNDETNEGVEADDLVGIMTGTIAPEKCIVLSGDSDFEQLISDRVALWVPDEDRLLVRSMKDLAGFYRIPTKLTIVEYKAERGIDPEAVITLKALQGDSTDNIPALDRGKAKLALAFLKKCVVDFSMDPEGKTQIKFAVRPEDKNSLTDGMIKLISNNIDKFVNLYMTVRIPRSWSESFYDAETRAVVIQQMQNPGQPSRPVREILEQWELKSLLRAFKLD